MLAHLRLEPASQAGARALASALSARRVSLAMDRGDGQLRLLGLSDGQVAEAAAVAEEALLDALCEAFDQQADVHWPAVNPNGPRSSSMAGRAEMPRVDHALRTLLATRTGAGSSYPLVADGRTVGAVCIEWETQAARDQARTLLPEHLMAWMAPVLALMHDNERGWARRLVDGARAWFASSERPERRWRRSFVPVLVAVLVGVAAWPATQLIGGPARLEGAIQRVLAAPADGFIHQVHARPGDRVRAGQPLVDLADRELQLERQRWHSQLAQQLDAHAAAQARQDRAGLAQHQAKADEAQAQLDLVDEKLGRARLLAPFDAVVVQGDLAQQLGAPVKQGTELMTLAPQGAYRVIVEIDERDVAELQIGQGGSLALSAMPWQALPLKVVRIAPVARATDGHNVFEVEAELPSPPSELRPGLLGQARIEAGTAPLAWQWTRRVLASLSLAWWRWVA